MLRRNQSESDARSDDVATPLACRTQVNLTDVVELERGRGLHALGARGRGGRSYRARTSAHDRRASIWNARLIGQTMLTIATLAYSVASYHDRPSAIAAYDVLPVDTPRLTRKSVGRRAARLPARLIDDPTHRHARRALPRPLGQLRRAGHQAVHGVTTTRIY